MADAIKISRALVPTLRAVVVAESLGFDWQEALILVTESCQSLAVG